MKKFKKCFSALFLSCFLAFGNISCCYLEVQAFEWVVPAIGIEEALKCLLMLLGVSVGAKVGEEVDWSELKQSCITFQEEKGNSAVAVSQWWDDVLSGSLNQASSCWSSFKEWVLSLKSGTSSSIEIISFLNTPFPRLTSVSPSNLYSFDIKYAVYWVNSNGIYCCLFNDNYEFQVSSSGFYFKPLTGSLEYYCNYTSAVSTSLNFLSDNGGRAGFFSDTNTQYYLYGVTVPSASNCHSWDVPSVSPDTSVDIAYPSYLNDFMLALQNAISDSIPDVIPLPWEQLGDTTEEIEDYLEGIIDAVNEGVLSLEDAMARIQTSLGVIAVDVPTNIIYPQNPDKPDETLQDKVQDNQDNMGFTLFGLEKVFPFCIPFDLYAFMTLLVADPVAPVINWPVYNPISGNNEIITIDFSTWESVVVLFRYIFDFLFIVGLLLMARALIGGGDSA